ncbi:amino acid adenylation domain-containing protein [Sorangium sp. KYC3313]|uniref:amino acid adenylation domain-containing protein n=1 Tax=Sorangium sp. KYC3313 TaxID=3449740 RepID=UPI003F89038C
MNGDVLLGDLDRCQTLVDLLRLRAEAQGDALAFRFLTTGDVDGGSEEWTFRDLHLRAMGIAASLQAAGAAADRALLLYAPGLDFIAAFMGCVYAGVVAVPTYPPNPAQLDRTLPRLRAIARDAGARFVLTTGLIASLSEALRAQAPELSELRWIATDALEPGAAAAWRAPDISGETLAFLQYTSGSTGHPKGVMVSHANVIANERAIRAGFEHDAGSSGVGWLPLFHDMGLIGNVLQPIFVGFPCTHMSPLAFLERPLRWLKAISHFRATTSGGPNFAYDLCARKATREDLAALDLRSWTVAFNGAEPIRAETLDRFAAAFAPCGFRREAFYPCYGLAEATLFASGGLRDAPPACASVDAGALARGVSLPVEPATAGARRLVSSGAPRARVAVVSPERGERVADGQIGEIWIAGPSVAGGYWGRAEETARAFGARLQGDGEASYLRTGDLGFLSGGELFVTGRIKDLIVIRGRNLYPDDIERTVEAAHPRVRPGCCAAFSIEVGGEERLGVAAELDGRGGDPPPDVVEALRSAVAREHDVQPHAVLLLRPRTLPKTSSGKVQRHACAQGFREGTLETLAVSVAQEAPAPAPAGAEGARAAADPARVLRLALRAVPAPARVGLLVDVVREELARLARVDLGSVTPTSKLMALGLDSLASVELQARFEELLGAAVPPQLLWQATTVEELSAALSAAVDAPAAGPAPAPAAADGEPAELSSHQLRLWFFCRFAPESPLYHVVFGARIVGALDERRLEESLAAVVRRHPALRTVFREIAGEPRQIVLPDVAVPLARARVVVDTTRAEEREERLRELAAAWGQAPFALEEGPLLRVCLVSLGERHHVLLFAQHHLVTDGRSIEVLVRDLAASYAGRADAPVPPLGYADYARAQRAALARMDAARAYWKAKLEGLPRLELGAERRRAAASPFAGGTVRFALSAPHVEAALAVARAENATLFVALASVYAALLHRTTGQEDLGIGVVVANRSRPEHQGVVGFFANTVVLRVDLGGRPTFRELVRRVRRTMAEAMEHAELPFDEVARAAAPGAGRDGERDALLQASFVLESASEPPAEVEGALWRPVLWAPDGAVEGTAKFDLGLSVARLHGELAAALEFRADRFARDEIERMTGHLGELLRSAGAEPDRPIDELRLLSPEEERYLLAGCNDTAAAFPRDACFHDLFREQASRTPERIAVACGEQRLSYAELDSATDRVARALSARGVGPDRLVALLTRRDLDFMLLALGAFKAAGAYVPLDPAHPARRNADILARAGSPPLLAGAAIPGALLDEIAAAGAGAIEVLPAGALLADAAAERGAPPAARAEHLAYVIFTSGSTGAPKGAMVEHRGMLNHLFAKVRSLGLGPADVVAQTAPITFDISVWQLLSPLLAGGTCRLVPDEIATDPARLLDAVGELGITVLEIVPSLLRGALDELEARPAWRPRLDGLRWLVLTGEALPPDLARRWLALYPRIPLMNAYGPTECSDDVAQHVIAEPPAEDAAYVPIGSAIQNTQLYVLDRRRQPVPLGVAGELYVGGDGVGRGYLRDPERTAAAFLPDPFSTAAGARLYRTGDLVRRLPGGELVFLGRIDHQIKLRGFRIELGEIEAVIARCAGIRDVVVVAREDAPGDPRLVAYVVPEAPSFDPGALKDQLSSRLPGYMIPAAIVALDALPLSANGKVDRKALPAPAWSAPGELAAQTAPRTGLEQAIGEVWRAVLGLDRVGVHDDFFAIGGHSLSATRAAARLRDVLGVDVGVRSLFEAPTIARLAAHIERSTRGEARRAQAPLAPAPRVGEEAPLSFAQQRLWFLDQLEPESATYNVPAALRLRGALDLTALARAIAEVVRRHEVLRATIHAVDGRPVQRFQGARETSDAWPLPLVDLSEVPAHDREEALQIDASREAARPFDLENGPLLRATLFRLAPDEHVLVVTLHHIASDGWSLGVLAHELTAAYTAFARDAAPALRPLPVQYADYAAWQRQELAPEMLQAEREIWRRRLDGAPPLDLPTDRPRPAARSSRGRTHRFALPQDLAAALRRRSQELGATLFMTLLAAFEALLHRYSGQQDFCVGTPVAGRGRTELEPLIGLFVNTLVLRARLDGDPTFAELVGRVKADALEAYAHQDLPFEIVVDALAVERDLSRNPLFQVMFALQNVPPPALTLPGVEASPVPLDVERARFDLTLFLTESGEAIEGALEFDLDLFDPETIARLAGHYETILRAVASDPGARVAELPLLTAGERRELLIAWNATSAPPPPAACLHELFDAQAERSPGAVAVASEAGELTYRELRRRADALARRLRALGVRPETRVGLCVRRTLDMVVALWAIFKAGGVHVPLDPGYPRQRLQVILEDAAAHLLVTERALSGLVPAGSAEVLLLDEIVAGADDAEDAQGGAGDALPAGRPDQAAYLIYTSGSTGRPKAVVIEHRQAVALARWARRTFSDQELAGVLASTSTCFDLSVFELVVPLCWGGKVVLADDALALPAHRRRNEVTLVNTVPSAAAALLAVSGIPGSVRTVCLAGEPLRASLARDVLALPHVERLLNLYGPSETTTYSTGATVTPAARPTIGRPIDHTQVYVLDARLQPVPVGVAGELYIAGAGVARGYLGRDELTAERFVPCPLEEARGARMYRTGDRARWLASGELEYLGRLDHQVKIRGFRVEPAETEAALAAHPDVREALVLARDDGPSGRWLVAYLLVRRPVDAQALRALVAERLPEPFVPSAFVELDAWPLNANGKVDRKALPAPSRPEIAPGTAGEARRAPATPTEQALAGVWSEVLGRGGIGATDDFFALGGHSLLAAQVIARARRLFGVALPLRAAFDAPTVAALAERIDRARLDGRRCAPEPLRPAPRGGDAPLSHAQQRLWFIEALQPGTAVYNMPIGVLLRGPLDRAALERSLDRVVARHEALRTRIEAPDGQPFRVVLPEARLELRLVDLSAVPRHERDRAAQRAAEEEARRPFDLASGLPIRAALIRLSDEAHVLLLTAHHIACDGGSIPVLFRDLSAFYEAARAGHAPDLPPLPVQYADVAIWQRAQADAWRGQLEYWKRQLSDLEPLELPTDRPRGSALFHRGDTVPVRLPAPLVEALRALGRREGATMFMVLLAGFVALLHRYTGRAGVAVGSPVSGRTQVEMEPLIGFFVNLLVLRVRVDDDPTFVELVRRVRQATLEAQEHQDVPFEQVVDALQVKRDLGRTPLFQAAFAFQGAPERPRRLGDLDASPFEVDTATAKFDLLLALEEDDKAVSGGIEFSVDLFDRATIERWRGHLEALLAASAAQPELRVGDLPLLGRDERDLVLHAFSGGRSAQPAPEAACAHRLVEAQAREAPGRAALLFEGATVSYGELDRRANQLAHHLRARGVRRGALVGVCLPRSPNMIVALLAVLKAGGAYVPLDPTYPRDRLAFMIEDARPALLVAQPELLAALPAALPPVVRLGESEHAFPHERADAPDAGSLPEDLAYVIYTSGSTGRPKGVLIEHRSLSAFAVAQRKLLGVEPGTRVLQFTRLSFDVSVMEIFVPLSAGGVVCLARAEALMPGPGLVDLLREQRIQVASLTPSALMAVGFDTLPDLRVLCVAGEVCPAELPRRWARGRRFVNGYGPTEATVLATAAEYAPDVARPTIGRPLPNTQVYVLDPRGQPAPVGIPGELHIGGIGLARGYLNRDDLTAARFVRAAFPEAQGARLYRTGDLVRWLPSGEIDFLGRLDEQVKIRGFRIELGEIEAVLASHPDVTEAAVVTREHAPGDVRLAAFFIPRGGIPRGRRAATSDALRGYLSDRLPDYMVPPVIAPVERWPQTPSGKIDRRALAASVPAALAALAGGARVPPRTGLELELCALFEELLGEGGVGVTDDFFSLGGHSLLAVRLMAEIRGRFGRDLPLTSLFRAPTVEGLAALLREDRGAPRGRTSVVVPLHAGGARAPLFFVHPIGGNVLCYADLARELGRDRPFYGIQAFGLETPPRPLASVGEMAEAYCEELRRVQPEGPYLLGGWSMGGVVAFEMARVLERSGHRVAAVVLLDAYLPPFDEPGDDLPPIAQFAADLARIAGAPAAAALAWPDGGAADAAWLLERAQKLGALPRGTTLGELEALLDAFQRNAALLARYAPGEVSARVELFRAEDSPHRDPRPAWAKWAPGLRSHVAAGDHYTLLRRPHVGALAERLRAALLEADPGAPREGAGAARPPG